MGLKQSDLKDLVYHIFEIDTYASKMGEDKNIVTLSFTVKSKAPADDLVRFLEGGYSFILDADATAGEQSDGNYRVFVELERNKFSNKDIIEIVDGVKKLSDVKEFKFRYYKGFKSCILRSRYNRLIVFPSHLYHSRNIFDNFHC